MRKLPAYTFLCALQVLMITIGADAQQVAPWEETILRDNCTDGPTLVSLEDRADKYIAARDSLDLVDPLLKKSARLAHACAKSTKSLQARDWYMFSYANDLFRSVSSSDEAQSSWPTAIKVLRDLSVNSKYGDVRSAARQSLQLAKQMEERTGVH